MFPQVSRAKLCLPVVFLLVLTGSYPSVVSAHTVKIAADVGATLHIEPNDNPQAGQPSQAWFALTRKGGKAIALKDCNCQLVVYAQPHTAKEPPLLEPPLKPITAERYQGTPGADIIFPKPGAYQLALRGKPIAGENFKPFELKFEVTVAASAVNLSQNSQDVNNDVVQSQSQSFPLWAIAAAIFASIGVVLAVRQKRKG
ncbi:hypothetical protein NIES2100_52440 [Calothrix sp. NIES-2100]|uniref:hypothetical protein n=1 Tax=Calothrix sp. NIES-2100 TaxID=1954172 RepID=UPI000B5EFC8B|nr:hypothetical protein NIES2100_52440 [Calothrix sp. NIES-2100]